MEARNRLPPARRGLYARRDILQLGALGVCGLSLPGFLKARVAAAAPARRRRGAARSCIILFQQGGPAQHGGRAVGQQKDGPASVPGRYQIAVGQITTGLNERVNDIYVLDTQTGQLWQKSFGGRGNWTDWGSPTRKEKKE